MPAIRNNEARFAATPLSARATRTAVSVITAVASLALALLTSCGAAQPTAVTVTTQAFRFQPAAFEWQAGRPIRLTLRNPDAVEHDFVVDTLRHTVASGSAGSVGHAHGPSAGPTPVPGSLHLHAAAFSETVLTFTPQSRGSYTVYCSVPGHKEVGMVAQLVVK
jgi:uncharacterized cupredoxin-like copper-binding protein